MSETNKQGLSKYIPQEIKDRIIKNSYHGCVICGNGLYDFEHIIPEYSEASSHQVDRMALLCKHHHGEVTNGSISKSKVFKAQQKPHNKTRLANREMGQFVNSIGIDVIMGINEFINCQNVFRIFGVNTLSVYKSENEFNPYVINCSIYSNSRIPIFEIKNNEIIVDVNNEFRGTLNGNKIKIEINNIFKIKIDLKANKNQKEEDKDVLNITKFFLTNGNSTFLLNEIGQIEINGSPIQKLYVNTAIYGIVF